MSTGPINNKFPLFDPYPQNNLHVNNYRINQILTDLSAQIATRFYALLQQQGLSEGRPIIIGDSLREFLESAAVPAQSGTSNRPDSHASVGVRPLDQPNAEFDSINVQNLDPNQDVNVPDSTQPDSFINPTGRNAQTWNQPNILQFLFTQFQQALSELYTIIAQTPPDQDAVQQQTGSARNAVNQTEQNLEQEIVNNQIQSAKTTNPTLDRQLKETNAKLGQSLSDVNQTISRNSQPSANSQQVVSSKLFLADMALKLLSVNQLGQFLVAQQAKQELPPAKDSTNIFIATQIGRMLGALEQLKDSIQKNPDANSVKFYQIIVGRLKEVMSTIQELGQSSAEQKQVMMQRLVQEAEWLATLATSAKTEGGKIGMNQQATTAAIAPKSNPAQMVPHPGMQPGARPATPVQARQDLAGFMMKQDAGKAASSQSRPSYFITDQNRPPVPLAPLAPRGPQELAAMIQMHLSRGIVQPLPLIVPYPVTIQLFDPVTGAEASQGEKAQNEERDRRRGYVGSKDLSQLMILIPAGPVIIGDPFNEGRLDERPTRIEQLEAFLIASTPVTNAQFAAWLSEALLLKKITIQHPGKIYDEQGRLLALTIEGAPLSQIELTSDRGVLEFRPIVGKDHHPVVHVTYDGAMAYCHANGLRLPSEAEWERAAGMMPTEYGQPLKKLHYACSNETLTPSWALYRDAEVKAPLNLSMPVGFFDGQKVYTKSGRTIQTNLSIGPWGCSDMSGNVREWTSSAYDEDGLFQTTKGGSYHDSVFDLRVAAKIPLPPSHSDPYTGFRVAL